jgi:hypothetical protein
MKKIILRIVVALGAIIALVLIYASTRPDTFRVERTISIKASPERIYAQINDFHAWRAWSPFEKIDPEMKRTYDGPASGTGAIYAWQGNSSIGSGSMQILDTVQHSKITVKLDFITPFEGHNMAQFTLVPANGSTNVTWAMYGPNTYLGKVMSVFFNMDKMVGPQFEKGLTDLRSISEQQ